MDFKTAIVRYDAAVRAIEAARSVHEVRQIHSLADAMRAFAKQAKNRSLEIDAAEIRFRAERRVGELMDAQRDSGFLQRGGDRKSNVATGRLKSITLAEAEIDVHLADRARKLAAIPLAIFETLVADWRMRVEQETERVTVHLLREGARHQQRRASSPPRAIEGQYRVVYADPPWSYDNSGVILDSDAYGRAARHYDTLSIAELCQMPVEGHLCADAVLFLWVTSPLLAECWPVITAWGFTYKTSIVWDKAAHNFGHYVSVRHELLLICTRGSCLPDRPTPMPPSVQTIKRSRIHSEKPTEFRALIERLYDGPRLELFARTAAPGWATWGDQVPDKSEEAS